MKATIKQTGPREVTVTLPVDHPCNSTDQVIREVYWIPWWRTDHERCIYRRNRPVTVGLGRLGRILGATPDTLLATIRAEHKARTAFMSKCMRVDK